jgi:predicted RNase H-like nuclease
MAGGWPGRPSGTRAGSCAVRVEALLIGPCHDDLSVHWADLAWGEGDGIRSANETGLAILDQSVRVRDVGWTRGIAKTVRWVRSRAGSESALLFVDAPLVVSNPTGQRPCETPVGQRYGRWKVSANTTNTGSRPLGGVALRGSLEAERWQYSDGFQGPPKAGHFLSECYPYTTLVRGGRARLRRRATPV